MHRMRNSVSSARTLVVCCFLAAHLCPTTRTWSHKIGYGIFMVLWVGLHFVILLQSTRFQCTKSSWDTMAAEDGEGGEVRNRLAHTRGAPTQPGRSGNKIVLVICANMCVLHEVPMLRNRFRAHRNPLAAPSALPSAQC